MPAILNVLRVHDSVSVAEVAGLIADGEAVVLAGGTTALEVARALLDRRVTCCRGLSAEHGLTAHDLPEVASKQAAIASARRVVVACDSGKFTRTAFGAVCPISRLDVVVTDSGIPREERDALVAAGVTVREVAG
ncbi:hypothetical protein [Nonomuraea sp. NPDC049480]|uniref:hypothetical protein n=1 Tax=Nonomuraea sp. NPDC049480 TaxID=3364353 RepID=UPI00378F353B